MTNHHLDLRSHEVRAALDDRLSLIVRSLEPQPPVGYDFTDIEDQIAHFYADVVGQGYCVNLPFALEDRLWGREAWRVGAWHYNNSEVALDYVDGPRKEWLHVDDPDQLHRLIDQSREDARAACIKLSTKNYYEYTWPPDHSPTRWRPSITMPPWASRLTLTVKDVDVKRVREISSREIITAGIRPDAEMLVAIDLWASDLHQRHEYHRAHIEPFRHNWNATHGPDAWDRNPWCAFYSVTVHSTNIDREG